MRSLHTRKSVKTLNKSKRESFQGLGLTFTMQRNSKMDRLILLMQEK